MTTKETLFSRLKSIFEEANNIQEEQKIINNDSGRRGSQKHSFLKWYDTVEGIFFNSEYSVSYFEELSDFFHAKKVTVEYMDSYGGEDQGSDYWSVYKFTFEGESPIFVKFDGHYYSYDGSTLDNWFLVEPKEVMVTQFVKV